MRNQRGFTYLGVLLAVALMGIGLTVASELWSTIARRQRLAQLEWVGAQYAQAIGSYYESTPGSVKTYPVRLEDLLEDRRVPFVRRHLRQLYVNPMTNRLDWELVLAPGGGVRGVRAMTAGQEGGTEQTREFAYVR